MISWNLQIIGIKAILDTCDYLGVPLASWYEMGTLSGFMILLNAGDETPYDISYYTYAGDIGSDDFASWALISAVFNLFFFVTVPLYLVILYAIGDKTDGVVTTGSTPLIGAVANRQYEGIGHGGIYTDPIVLADILNDFKT